MPSASRTARGSQKKSDIASLLSYRLLVVSSLLSRSQLRQFGSISGISLAEWRTLALVGNFGPLAVKGLSRHAGLDFGQTSRLVSRMFENGLIGKKRGDDGRSITLSLTPAGRALHRRLWTVAMRCNDEFLASLSSASRKGLLDALDTLTAKAKETLRR